MFRDVFTSYEPLNQYPVEYVAGCIVDVSNMGFRLAKPGISDQAFQVVAFTIAYYLFFVTNLLF